MYSKSLHPITAFFMMVVSIVISSPSNLVAAPAPLIAGTDYTITLEKMLTDGTISTVATTTAVADANAKIAFSFSSVPNCPTTNFLSIKITTTADPTIVVRRSFSPAPPANSQNGLGANGVSTKQAEGIVAAGALIGSDNPMVVAFGLLFTRTDQLTTSDISNIAILGREGIQNGMETYMTSHGVTATQMTTFKQKLVCNQPKADLSNFTSLFKNAVDTPAQASDDMAKAAGVIGDAFIDAAAASGIDLDTILAAFDAAGDKVNTGPGATAFGAVSAAVQASMMQGINSFRTRLAVKKVQQRYSAALTTLGVSGAELTRFNAAVVSLGTDLSANEILFAKYFENPATFNMSETIDVAHVAGRLDKTIAPISTGITQWINAGSPAWTNIGQGLNPALSKVSAAVDYSFNLSFATFSTVIASTSAEITTMRNNISTAIVGSLTMVPGLAAGNVGTYQDFSGTTRNWPIPQTGSVNFISTNIIAGGSLAYTRNTTPVPANMSWLNAGSGTRTTNFQTGNPNYEALLGMQEDVMIAEFSRFDIYNPANGLTGGNPSGLQRQAAQAAFKTNLTAIATAITGTIDGTINLTTAQKRALVLSQQQPSIN